ncbi:protein of unknown function [Brevefilum fermentans]|uniref:Uncharacterized protein n=1 Tax=Candidatus Brevifilum fermentans TaxID=1986204 RepID=A0A1Y6K5Y5_9CHLR|nr:protein of unknown function [Brevefilum fermentans]
MHGERPVLFDMRRRLMPGHHWKIRLNKRMTPREYPKGTMFESRFWHLYPEGVLRGPTPLYRE